MESNETYVEEKALLGACISSKEMYYKISSRLDAEDFQLPAHRIIFDNIQELFNSGEAINSMIFNDYLKKKKLMQRVGGESAMMEIYSYDPLPDEVDYYINTVKDKALSVRFFDLLSTIESDFKNKPVPDISEFIGDAERKIINLASKRRVSDFKTTEEVVKSLQLKIEDDFKMRQRLNITQPYMTGYPTGYESIDRMTGGFHPGDLMILAARPGVGKSALALNLGQKMAEGGRPVAIFSLEMSAEQNILRILSMESDLSTNEIQAMKFDELGGNEKAFKLQIAINKINKEKIYIDDTSALRLSDIVVKTRKLKAAEPQLGLVIIDYLGLITAPGRGNSSSRQQEVSDITRGLKTLAKDLEVPILCLAQLSRGVELRKVHKPILSDLRDSGSIEQDADMVFFIYRADYYKNEQAEDDEKPGRYRKQAPQPEPEVTSYEQNDGFSPTTLILSKNRSGRIGEMDFQFDKVHCRFNAVDNTISEDDF